MVGQDASTWSAIPRDARWPSTGGWFTVHVVEDPFVPTFLTELPLARDALLYAHELHRGQRRASDDAPFILHALEVAALLHTTGYDEPAVTAGILHDSVEDTAVEVDPRSGSAAQRGGASSP